MGEGTAAAQFRGDIEGLRALAVVPILLFHLDPAWCPGGYVGVDIFFVISGYLVTRMILADGADFRFTTFCARRFYRLFPALAVTLALTLAAGWKLLPPSDYAALASSSIAALFGVSNVWFHATIDYFNAGSHQHPLLHTWSLAVEAQFYLVWPAILLIAGRARLPLWLTAAIILALSLAGMSAVTALLDDGLAAAFYLTPFRMFEFAIGAGAVAIEPRLRRAPRWFGLAAGTAGLAGLLAAFVLLDRQTAWPSLWTAGVAAATAALILAGPHPVWQAVFGNAPTRFLGRISYSLYLVHWPIITLYRQYAVTDPALVELVALGAVSVAAGWALHVLVEQPMRNLWRPKPFEPERPATASAPRLFAMLQTRAAKPLLLAVSAGTIAAGSVIAATGGVPSRIARERVETLDGGLSFGGDLCSTKAARCAIGDPGGSRTVFLVGDSHALNLVHGLDRLFRDHRVKGIVLYDHGCLFAVGTVRFSNGVIDKKCRRNVADAYAVLAGTRAPVILAMDWAGYQTAVADEGATAAAKETGDAYFAWLEQRMRDGLGRIGAADRPVVLVKQTHNTGVDLPKCLASPRGAADPAVCKPHSRTDVMQLYASADAMADRLAAAFAGVRSVDPKRVFCSEETCTTAARGDLLFRDTTHLTRAGSAYVVERLRGDLEAALLASAATNAAATSGPAPPQPTAKTVTTPP